MDPITAGHSVNLTSRTEVWPKSGETAGEKMCRRTAWRICSAGGWSGVISKNGRGRHRRAGPPVHDDLVERDFTAVGPNELWLTDITEHWTAEGKLYLCAIKDVYSGRIVGYSIDSRMQSRLAVNALNSAVARRGEVTGCVLHSEKGSQFRSKNMQIAITRHGLIGSNGQGRCVRRQRRHGELLLPATEQRPRPPILGLKCPGFDGDIEQPEGQSVHGSTAEVPGAVA